MCSCSSSTAWSVCSSFYVFFFFFNDTATTEIYTLSLHDALPISFEAPKRHPLPTPKQADWADRKSTRLNSSHANISYAVFCLKKKNQNNHHTLISTIQNTHSTTDPHMRIR